MPQGSRYIKQAIRERWTAESLDDPFIALRGSTSSNPVLDSGEIAPGTPFPYCVMAQTAGSKVASMSGKTSGSRQEMRQVNIDFNIHAKTEEQAADLADTVMAAFDDVELTLAEGGFVQAERGQEFGVRQGDSEWQWTVPYQFMIDETITPAS